MPAVLDAGQRSTSSVGRELGRRCSRLRVWSEVPQGCCSARLGPARRHPPTTAESPTFGAAPASVAGMLTELVVLFAVLLRQHMVRAFLAICAACLVYGVTRRRANRGGESFVRAAGRSLSRALVACQRIFLASALVVAAACGFAAGQWDGWVVAVVAWAAVWATWASLIAGQQHKDAKAVPSSR